MTEKFESLNPATGDVVGTYPIHDADDVAAAVARAREAAVWWSTLSFSGRREYLDKWNAVITRRIMQLANVSHEETGKPHGDAQLEIMIAIDHIAWAGSHA